LRRLMKRSASDFILAMSGGSLGWGFVRAEQPAPAGIFPIVMSR
jgi:hypothetical protein